MSIALVSILAVGVLFLAALQYQWIGRLSEAERDRLQARLASSVELFRDSFNRELTQLCNTFRPDPFAPVTEDASRYGHLREEWRDSAQHPDLLETVFVGRIDADGRLTVSHYDENAKDLRPEARQEYFAGIVAACTSTQGFPGTSEERFRRPGLWNLAFAEQRPILMRPLYRFQSPRAPGPTGPGRPAGYRVPRRPQSRGPGPPAYTIPPGPPLRSPGTPSGYLFLELNGRFVYERFLPELEQRIFGGPGHSSYQVVVFLGKSLSDPVYSSAPQPVSAGSLQFDARIELLWGTEGQQPRARGPIAGMGPGQFTFRPRPLVASCDPGMQWMLAVRHQAGSVDLAAQSLRRRNLAVSAAVLILLTLSIVLIIIFAQRSQRLARLQMEFAAGISHEVRTPLAVISSAGDNLAEGVIAVPDRVQEYGDLIRREARRLSGMVEQTLRFAAMQSGTLRYDLGPVDAGEVVQAALAELAPITDDAGFEVEQHSQDAIPLVLADPAALSRCVQNLVTNALKYGGENRKITVGIARSPDAKRPVRVSVSDHGLGILPQDLPYIFEPFYQGRSPAGAKSQGVGLGLALAKDMIEAMDGRITVDTKPGRGTSFTLHLRAAGEDPLNHDESKNTAG